MHRHTTPSATVSKPADSSSLQSSTRNGYDGDDDALLEQIGYQPSFRREFTSLSTVGRAAPLLAERTRAEPLYLLPTDKLRVQCHGPLLERRDDVQHAAVRRRACVRDLVLDPRLVHVPHARFVPPASWSGVAGADSAYRSERS